MKSLTCLGISLLPATTQAQFLVFDPINTAEAKLIADNTQIIISKNQQILNSINKTLKAVTGDRSSEVAVANNVALGKGFSASDAMPSAQIATDKALDVLLDAVKTEFSVSAKRDYQSASLEALARTTIDMNVLLKGIRSALKERKGNLEALSNQIGRTKDLKSSIDMNNQINVQLGIIINELIGIENTSASANQTSNQRTATDIFNSMKAMSYAED